MVAAREGGLEAAPANSALVRDVADLIERPLSEILANTEFACSVLAGALEATSSGGDGATTERATKTALSALREASGCAREISALLNRLRDVPEHHHPSDGHDGHDGHDGIQRSSFLRELSPAHAAQRPRVLVIDDDVRVGTAIQRSLQDRYEVLLETSPHTAVYRLLLGEECDVILCDVMMPGMTGIEVFKAIGASRRELVPRFVFMSGGARLPESAEFFNRSTHVLVQKPFTTPELMQAIEGVIRLTKVNAR